MLENFLANLCGVIIWITLCRYVPWLVLFFIAFAYFDDYREKKEKQKKQKEKDNANAAE